MWIRADTWNAERWTNTCIKFRCPADAVIPAAYWHYDFVKHYLPKNFNYRNDIDWKTCLRSAVQGRSKVFKFINFIQRSFFYTILKNYIQLFVPSMKFVFASLACVHFQTPHPQHVFANYSDICKIPICSYTIQFAVYQVQCIFYFMPVTENSITYNLYHMLYIQHRFQLSSICF